MYASYRLVGLVTDKIITLLNSLITTKGSFHFKTDLYGNPMFQILTIFLRYIALKK